MIFRERQDIIEAIRTTGREHPMAQNIERELQEQISRLPNEQQRQVLEFARSLADSSRPNGSAGRSLLAFAGTIEENELKLIEQAIDRDCECVR